MATACAFVFAGDARAATPASQPSPASATKYASDNALLRLNQDFTDAYDRLLAKTTPKLNPVIIECGEGMALLRNGTESRAPAFGRRYSELEAVSHVPVTIYVMLTPQTGGLIGQVGLDELRAYRASVVGARAALPGADLTPEERARQEGMIDRALAFIDATVAARQVSIAALRAYARDQTADIMANVSDAARNQIDTMDKQASAWTSAMSAAERARLKVAVCGPHMPRVGNISMQYFAAALGYPYGGRYQDEPPNSENLDLIYAESTYDRKKILDMIAIHAIDANLGESFFSDPARMHRDLLADSAEEILRSRFPNAHPTGRRCTPAPTTATER
ncbi:MAG TPA: hypothetical protein VJX23_01820 [Candidatus Binataceae bacterium]|nr:hypothetical protein [Candidatus Binataceae bacterium]